jgi:MinD-like ATPase involved in chromosome partitioning or flagellar assembly
VPFSMNAGTPIVVEEPKSPVARALRDLASRFTDEVAPATPAGAGAARWPWRRDAR